MARCKQIIVFCVLALLLVGVVLRVARDLVSVTGNRVPPGAIWGEVAPAIMGVVLLVVLSVLPRGALRRPMPWVVAIGVVPLPFVSAQPVVLCALMALAGMVLGATARGPADVADENGAGGTPLGDT